MDNINNSNSSDIIFLKKRLEISQKENEILKKENGVIKKELL